MTNKSKSMYYNLRTVFKSGLEIAYVLNLCWLLSHLTIFWTFYIWLTTVVKLSRFVWNKVYFIYKFSVGHILLTLSKIKCESRNWMQIKLIRYVCMVSLSWIVLLRQFVFMLSKLIKCIDFQKLNFCVL